MQRATDPPPPTTPIRMISTIVRLEAVVSGGRIIVLDVPLGVLTFVLAVGELVVGAGPIVVTSVVAGPLSDVGQELGDRMTITCKLGHLGTGGTVSQTVIVIRLI